MKQRRTRAAPPAIDSNRLSTSICRAILNRDAPSAARTANSFRRAAARASKRLATLAHAISNTSPTAPKRIFKAVLTLRVMLS